jgi:hypothetical protein
MNLIYNVVVKNTSTGAVISKMVLSKDLGGVAAAERATAAVLTAAGTGYIIQNVNLQNIDIDLTV